VKSFKTFTFKRKFFLLVLFLINFSFAHSFNLFKGKEVNSKDMSLDVASILGETEIVKKLLESGVDVNEKNEEGETALHIASLVNNVEIVKLLLESGADVNVKNTLGQTALHVASSPNNVEVIKLLLEFGANPNVKTKKGGATPLHYASIFGKLEVVKLLIASGADIHTKTYSGKTAKDIAIEKGYQDIVEILADKEEIEI